MNRKLYGLVAGLALVTLAGAAHSGGPVPLSDTQMDQVTAGFTITYKVPAGGTLMVGFPVDDGVSGLLSLCSTISFSSTSVAVCH